MKLYRFVIQATASTISTQRERVHRAEHEPDEKAGRGEVRGEPRQRWAGPAGHRPSTPRRAQPPDRAAAKARSRRPRSRRRPRRARPARRCAAPAARAASARSARRAQSARSASPAARRRAQRRTAKRAPLPRAWGAILKVSIPACRFPQTLRHRVRRPPAEHAAQGRVVRPRAIVRACAAPAAARAAPAGTETAVPAGRAPRPGAGIAAAWIRWPPSETPRFLPAASAPARQRITASTRLPT